MHDPSHEQDARRRKAQGQEEQGGEASRQRKDTGAEVHGRRGPATQECDRDAAIQMIEENEDSRKMIESMSEGSDEDMERTLQNYRTAGYEVLGGAKNK